jgi:small subunit ribosomal protein S16
MLKIRLQRVGRKNIPVFRVLVTDSQNSTKSGKFLEILGIYDPVSNKKEVNADRVKHWISKGAQVTGTVHNFLVAKKIIEGKKINVLPAKKAVLKRKDAKKAASEKKEAPKAVPAQ